MTALTKAIRFAGSATNLARGLGVSNMTVSQWKNRFSGVVPAERVIPIYKLTGVTPHELRPDIYPNPNDGLASPTELHDLNIS
ncbi:helix-turn-helix domain-containing protein [Xenorhabdus bovienii]|uniref:transcriptional regulator n=1 Tax=Xenorhabdus bovienii TaxID=40576 RepID=UPI001EE007EF|nr:YdaS family helix-turn-helix protein [Xenorhabdus bovienii]MCG3462641.1 helix-turn-helix domain-containing protein [Xenorhabdus bovienii]MDE1494509.1 helix-turn-helix domain-containing protein [Xenorhabdus bovienii]MDE9437405.1 helix-turn-helix domain-containing protein [Xenorhabdus bovienii]MDE9472651.1 helix-turn-helix domain-containing protein [Xenorhabdus bovienii]MDE9499246.1 helix-turn-helix domain-containing protein [Xenorhabdus bovienii]